MQEVRRSIQAVRSYIKKCAVLFEKCVVCAVLLKKCRGILEVHSDTEEVHCM